MKVVKSLLDEEADVNAPNNFGMTALTTATWKGYVDTVNV